MIDKIAGLVNADTKLVRRGRFVNTTFMIAIDDLVHPAARGGRQGDQSGARPIHYARLQLFCLRASRDVWEKFWEPLPPLGYTDIFALVKKQKLMRVEGDLHPFMTNLLYFKDVIAAPRQEAKR